MQDKMNKKGFIGRLIEMFVATLVGLSLIPVIIKQTDIAKNNINGTAAGWAETILNFVPFLFGLGILFIGIMMVASFFKDDGGNKVVSETRERKKEKSPHELASIQTIPTHRKNYKEYKSVFKVEDKRFE